jgi:hypothetical protein
LPVPNIRQAWKTSAVDGAIVGTLESRRSTMPTPHRTTPRTTTAAAAAQMERIHRIVLSLPWVVERPRSFAPGVRVFDVECGPLRLRRLWLVTGLGAAGVAENVGVAVILPSAAVEHAECNGWGVPGARMPGDRVIVKMGAGVDDTRAEALVFTAYGCAMSSAR